MVNGRQAGGAELSTTFTLTVVGVWSLALHMYPFESSLATNRHGKPTASATSDEDLVHTDDKHHLRKNLPSKSMPSEGRQTEWTIRAIYLIGFMVRSALLY